MRRFVFILTLLLACSQGFAQESGPRVLVVTAHPDDESGFAATIYKITHDLHGVVDVALITNGEGGYKYSTLAEAYYGLDLTDEKVGRQYLPTIRKQELMNAGKILGVHNFYFFDQKDNRYMLSAHEALDSVWDTVLIQRRLHDILIAGNYDFIFTLMPVDSTHGHHKGATISALSAVSKLTGVKKPILLAGTISKKGDTATSQFRMLHDYPITELARSVPFFRFDRTTKFGYRNIMDYKIVVNWEIAEHKSQGTVQLGMNMGDYEDFYYYKLNDPSGVEQTKKLFADLGVLHFKQRTYLNEIK